MAVQMSAYHQSPWCLGYGQNSPNLKRDLVPNLRLFGKISIEGLVYCMPTSGRSQYSHYPWYWVVPVLPILRLKLKRLSVFDRHFSFATEPSCFTLSSRPASFLSSSQNEVWCLSGNSKSPWWLKAKTQGKTQGRTDQHINLTSSPDRATMLSQ